MSFIKSPTVTGPEEFLKQKISFWRTKVLSNRGTTNNVRIAQDSMRHYVNLYNEPLLIDSLGRQLRLPGQLMDENRNHIFYTGLIHITYTGESEEPEYAKLNQNTRDNEQHSTILIKKGGITIYDNGYFEPLGNVFFDGYMMWSDRISNLLPREYVPRP